MLGGELGGTNLKVMRADTHRVSLLTLRTGLDITTYKVPSFSSCAQKTGALSIGGTQIFPDSSISLATYLA